ncbi:MAG: acyl-ACP desaturase [Pyrinomonadaceae bacterium MAG19_C2-C3]|nr:acyl-ACP desaturase [Pyrinomonadaceae bacterium MAG19_C2-C3]
MFETERDVLAWYESQPRALTKEFLDDFKWKEIDNYELNKAFIPVLIYMRDVESFTQVYYDELLRTPTGKDPVIRRFMDRWSEEENQHGELLNRFLLEAGVATTEKWEEEARQQIPIRYTMESRLTCWVTNLFGRHFTGTHMAWGAINEMTTLQGYRRLWKLAEHPILEELLRAVAQEEALHSRFYWSIAQLKLKDSNLSQRIARKVIDQFWAPVGTGTKPPKDVDYLIKTLFSGEEGVEHFDRTVNKRAEQLPGFDNFTTTTDRVKSILQSSLQELGESENAPVKV